MLSIQEIAAKLGSKERVAEFIAGLSTAEAAVLMNDWALWAMPHQRMPGGNWRRWIVRAGRGSGKTYCGAKWVNEIAKDKDKIRDGEIGIISETHTKARKVSVEGPSGILATSSDDFRPSWEPGKGKLTWPNGVVGHIYSADKPSSLRGPNWSFVWADEICFWPNPERTWGEVIEPALRIGWARAIITTTPLPDRFLRDLEAKKSSVTTRASTYDNKFLKKEVLAEYEDLFKGTRRGAQELWGKYLDRNPHALWDVSLLERSRIDPETFDFDSLTRIVVAVDPAVTSHEDSDSTGIVVAGMDGEGIGYILEDRTMKGQPHEWAKAAADAYSDWGANYVVAEVNQGGDLVESNIRQVKANIAYKAVRAKKSKELRAEPVSTAYVRGRIKHVGFFPELEDQQVNWQPGKPSPDRLDAAVYALTELVIGEDPPRDFSKIGSALRTMTWR